MTQNRKLKPRVKDYHFIWAIFWLVISTSNEQRLLLYKLQFWPQANKVNAKQNHFYVALTNQLNNKIKVTSISILCFIPQILWNFINNLWLFFKPWDFEALKSWSTSHSSLTFSSYRMSVKDWEVFEFFFCKFEISYPN